VNHRRCATCGLPFVASRSDQRFCGRKCQVKSRNLPPSAPQLVDHVVIPDTQVKPGVPTVHMEWIGRYINDRYMASDKQVVVVHLGDHWDMPSLSSYDKGRRRIEGRRIASDITAGNEAFAVLDACINGDAWVGRPRKVFLLGNHEDRISRACDADAQLDGLLSLDALDTLDWERHRFLEPVNIDGVTYAHYFANPMTGRPYSGQNIETRLKTIGTSFTMGHQQTLQYGLRFLADGRSVHGLVAGACYLHDEDYLGPQGNAHWRGIVVCHEVHNGSYDVMPVSMNYLCRRYTGNTLDAYMRSL
jgi:hypothetical protein